MKKALYPGSFDPITNGHVDILERSLNLVDEITILVAETDLKNPLFSMDERQEIISEVIKEKSALKSRVKVDRWEGLTMDYAKKNGFPAVIRGLRAASDFEYEFMMASMNKNINSKIETLFMMTSQHLYYVSSTMIRSLFRYSGDISPYVPDAVVRHLKEKRS